MKKTYRNCYPLPLVMRQLFTPAAQRPITGQRTHRPWVSAGVHILKETVKADLDGDGKEDEICGHHRGRPNAEPRITALKINSTDFAEPAPPVCSSSPMKRIL